MSRPYRIRIKESVSRVIRAHDHVRTELDLLPVLSPEQMASLLADELAKHGFRREGDKAVRKEDGVTVTVDLMDGSVVVETEASQQEERTREDSRSFVEQPNEDRIAEARKGVRDRINREIDEKEQKLQRAVTDKLERALADVRDELNQSVNRATAGALKVKAAQLGEIKEITEDESGSMTIVVEV
ncbi:MAG: hypothetical protein QGG36_18255 [Pirellulaceae bacterium]|jgi:hypothetical protein|nr:hypothetical protein [Pirellulaceae bacterium]MDP7017753.1 hypothetical protein [Pirellulaceae bacterium]